MQTCKNHKTPGIVLLLLSVILWSQSFLAMAVEEPAFDLIDKSASFEIRQYRAQLIAETIVEGEMRTASNRGFRVLASFIFGSNRIKESGTDKAEKISMTAPVTVEPQTGSMAAAEEANRWRIQFTMPSKYSITNLPQPLSPAIHIREVPAKRYAVVTFSGLSGAEKIRQKTLELLNWMQTKQLQAVGQPQLARYDPPWILPFFRRNEILVEIPTSE